MSSRARRAGMLVQVGYVLMLAGALDPLEGSVLILAGGAGVALGTYLAGPDRPWLALRVWVLVLLAVGVGALVGLSAAGGLGGQAGLSPWWGLLLAPYLGGWGLGIWGPGSPRWVRRAAGLVGVWYLAIPVMVLLQASPTRRPFSPLLLGLGLLGLAMVALSLWRWRQPVPPSSSTQQ